MLPSEKLWESHQYESASLPEVPEATEDELRVSDTEDQDEALHYVAGDVTKPQETSRPDAVILHCVGGWAQSGF